MDFSRPTKSGMTMWGIDHPHHEEAGREFDAFWNALGSYIVLSACYNTVGKGLAEYMGAQR